MPFRKLHITSIYFMYQRRSKQCHPFWGWEITDAWQATTVISSTWLERGYEEETWQTARQLTAKLLCCFFFYISYPRYARWKHVFKDKRSFDINFSHARTFSSKPPTTLSSLHISLLTAHKSTKAQFSNGCNLALFFPCPWSTQQKT